MTSGPSAVENFITENYSNTFPDVSPQDDNIMNMARDESAQENIASQGASIQLYASTLFGTAKSSEFDSIFNFNGKPPMPLALSNEPTPIPASSTIIGKTVSDVNSFTPLVQDKESSASCQTENILFGGSTSCETNLVESINSSNEGTLESEIRNSVASYEAHELPRTKPMNLTEADVNEPVSNVQISSFTIEETRTPQHEESPPVQAEASKDSIAASNETIHQMRSVQEALELQIEELRRENTHLLGRQTELTNRIEESERLAHEFKLEKDRVREEATTTSQALRARINSLCEENQRIVKNSTDIGVDLRVKFEEKSKQLEEMQQAFVKVSESKMDFAAKLDHELERVKELQSLLKEKDDNIIALKIENSELQEKLKQDYQKDAIIHQMQDQARHYQVQCETLSRELGTLRNKLKNQHNTNVSPLPHSTGPSKTVSHDPPNEVSHHHHTGNSPRPTALGENDESNQNHQHSEEKNNHSNDMHLSSEAHQGHSTEHHGSHDHGDHSHDHSDDHHANDNDQHQHIPCGDHDHHHHAEDQTHNHDHVHEDGHHHDPDNHVHESDTHHHHNHHVHESDHHHDHVHESDHHHTHDHHDHNHDSCEKVIARRGPSDELTELKKTLHRLQWENSSFRNEMDVLTVDAKQKRAYEDKCSALAEENQRLRKEVEQLEHVIIQLQGENDTIGDYITLYQTQKMALKECAKEKDAQLELLAREREMLLHRLAELTALVKDLKDSKSEAGSQCADDHTHMLDSAIPLPANKRQIEGKIRDLLTEISSSSLIENFHPCALCSGRLMTV